jgi:voltage-gated potassium channel
MAIGFPVTAVGREVAVVLMAAGVGVFGLLPASMASFFIQHRSGDSSEPTLGDVMERLDRIEKTLQTGGVGEGPRRVRVHEEEA